MEQILRRSFASPLPVASMEEALAGAGGLDWQSRETPEDGFYLRGLTKNGVKVRLLPRGERVLAEVHFPIGPGWTRFTDEEKTEFMRWLDAQILTAVKAADLRDER